MTRGTPIPTRLLLIVLALNLWAASTKGAAHLRSQARTGSGRHARSEAAKRPRPGRMPEPVSFREERNRGLLIDFFFQAEDGIRDLTVTGVQTCALPICWGRR